MTKFTDYIIFNKITDAFLVRFDINDNENPYGEWGFNYNAVGLDEKTANKISQVLMIMDEKKYDIEIMERTVQIKPAENIFHKNLKFFSEMKESIVNQFNVDVVLMKKIKLPTKSRFDIGFESNLGKFLINYYCDSGIGNIKNFGKFIFFYCFDNDPNSDRISANNFINTAQENSTFSDVLVKQRGYTFISGHMVNDYYLLTEGIDDELRKSSLFYVYSVEQKQLFEI